MKMLVMGGTSFVSKCFAMYAIEKGYTVDIFTRGRSQLDYEGVNEQIIGDRRNIEDLQKLSKKSYDYVVDICAYTQDDVSMLSEALDTKNIKRYVLCSTCSVYMMPEDGKIVDEESPKGFDKFYGGDYGYNKMKAEEYLLNSDIPVTIFRPTYIYGEHNNIFRDAYLFESIERGKVNTIEDIYPSQFVYVWDLVKSFESCLNNDKSIDQAYNVVNETPVNWSDWVEAGFYAVGKRAKVCVFTQEMLKNTQEQVFPFGNADIFFSGEKLKEHGLYVPKTSLREGLKNAYAWYKTVEPSIINKRRFEIIK